MLLYVDIVNLRSLSHGERFRIYNLINTKSNLAPRTRLIYYP